MQLNARRLGAHPRTARLVRAVVPLLGAAVLVWRTVASGGAGAGPSCH